jgi:hypothetical protein
VGFLLFYLQIVAAVNDVPVINMKHFVEMVDAAIDKYTDGDQEEAYITLNLGVRRCARSHNNQRNRQGRALS